MTTVSTRQFRPSRRAVFGLGGTALAVTGLAACGGGSGGAASGGFEEQDLALPTYVEPPVPEGGIASEVEGMPMIFTAPVQEYFTSVEEAPGAVKRSLRSRCCGVHLRGLARRTLLAAAR